MTTAAPNKHMSLEKRLSLGRRLNETARDASPVLLAVIALAVILAITAVIRPHVFSVSGLTLMLVSAVPLVLATQAQLIMMAVGDIDLGAGALVGFVTVVASSLLVESPVLAVALFMGILLAYVGLAWIVQHRGVPAIILTLGMSFVWLGIGLQIMPTPGGATPTWLSAIGTWRPGWFPAPIVFIVIATLLGWFITQRSTVGMRIRALGSESSALEKAGRSLTSARIWAYVFAGILFILAGLTLASQTQSGDANSASDYTLTTIAAVILGGGSFAGGVARPIGATLGAVTLALITILLTLVDLPSSLQSAAQGIIVLAVLAGRIITERLAR